MSPPSTTLSSIAVTVTSCGVLQFALVKVRMLVLTVTCAVIPPASPSNCAFVVGVGTAVMCTSTVVPLAGAFVRATE